MTANKKILHAFSLTCVGYGFSTIVIPIMNISIVQNGNIITKWENTCICHYTAGRSNCLNLKKTQKTNHFKTLLLLFTDKRRQLWNAHHAQFARCTNNVSYRFRVISSINKVDHTQSEDYDWRRGGITSSFHNHPGVMLNNFRWMCSKTRNP